MGGSGSGRRWNKKSCVEDCLRLTVKAIIKYPAGFQGWVKWSSRGEQIGMIDFYRLGDLLVRLSYKTHGEDMEYNVSMTTTELPWGKLRYWWTCPHCGRRVAFIYAAGGSKYFLCRRCHNLAYRSNQEEGHERTMNRFMEMLEREVYNSEEL
jgi:hypothetical protein